MSTPKSSYANSAHPGRRARIVGLIGGLAVAVVVWLVAPAWLSGTTRAVAAYDAAAILFGLVLWKLGMHDRAEATQRRSAVEDPGRDIMFVIVLLSVAVGLLSAISILGRGPHAPTLNEKLVAYGIAITAVATGWMLIHAMFLFRYAHLFYHKDDENEAERGLTFPGTENPNDYDFAYFSFVVGMTFQVSDVQITDPGIRRVVLVHGLISFAYNTAIVALGINVLSGLLH
ncbi:MAG: DUF1345 domain-containing protein [Candidatus Eremiobacteraeota bacterium]|nr:DUF1345 domain-containing protein [Candidatus Eremiobacteraeota bacterium]